MTKLYLDVDGVINCDEPRGWGTTSTGTAKAEGETWLIRWAPGMIGALRMLDLDVTWLTTWREHAAPQIGGLIGYGSRSPYLDWKHKFSDSGIAGKWLAVQEDFPQGEKFVWIDDLHEEFTERWTTERGGLIICPDYRYGISPANIDTIRNYLNE